MDESQLMPLLGRGMDDGRGRRLALREPQLFSASILTLERSYCAAIADVSQECAQLKGCRNVDVGETLWLKVGCLDELVTVTSCGDASCTVRFEQPLSHEDVIHLRCEGRNTLVMPLAEEEKSAARDWISGLKR